jgi:choline dehydrogenase-like flavoprotein
MDVKVRQVPIPTSEKGREETLTLTATAKKEVIICGGAIDSPKLLLLNGIGPRSELEALGVECKVDLPGVGKNLHDHILTFMTIEVSGSINDRYVFESSEQLMKEAEEAWKLDHSGAFALQNSVLWGGFLKLPNLQTFPEYQALPENVRGFLGKEAVPHYEFVSNLLLWPPGTKISEGNTYITFIAFLMNPQSRGSVSLSSSTPTDKPAIKLNYLTHAYDRRVMREAVKSTWTKVTTNPVVAPHMVRTLLGPKSLGDEDVEDFMREQVTTVWHAGGTCRMGKQGDEGAVVDSACRVRGVEGLRVVDMSVAPVCTNNHTQATAYLIAQKASEMLVEEYGLDVPRV